MGPLGTRAGYGARSSTPLVAWLVGVRQILDSSATATRQLKGKTTGVNAMVTTNVVMLTGKPSLAKSVKR
ncbi:MAG: hypothetical protein JJLCMIEE_02346 [Acidimicrobiales bacterium]|nr:hypothetical protein [Acidimicrobiales bacterium]